MRGPDDRGAPRWDTWRDPRWAATLVFLIGFALAPVVRILFLQEPGLTGDLDQFVLWVHGIATQPFGHAYDMNISFPPVMVYIWAWLTTLTPDFQSVTTSADPAIRALMKLPATLADLGLGLLVAMYLRRTPGWAILGSFAILFHPAVIDVSAWWGQYESIYVLFGAVAFVLAVRGHSLFAAVALAVAVMTKPQALPFLVPFAAWFVARDGWLGAAKAAAVGAATIVVLWLPFVGAGGPQGYLRNLGEYQGEIFAILSIRAWNPWWLVQELFAGGQFVSDAGLIVGPITLRHVGYGLALLGELAVFLAVYRARTPRALALGLAAAILVAFCLLTSMHERYAFGVLVFLPLAFPDRRAAWLAAAFGVVFTLNLLAAVPPTPDIAAALPVSGLLGIVGSIAMTGIAIVTLKLLLDEKPGPTATS